jgi:HflK protein
MNLKSKMQNTVEYAGSKIARIAQFLSKGWKKFRVVFKLFHRSCDKKMEEMVATTHFRVKEIKVTKQSVSKIQKFTFIVVLPIIAVVLVIALLANYLFIVPVGANAVVTRFGAFNRDVDSGLHLRLPFAEQYYIVETYNLMEETFGFLQQALPAASQQATAEEQFFINYEQQIVTAEQDTGNPFSTKGHILDSLNQRQRLPYDYLIKKNFPGANASAVSLQADAKDVIVQKQPNYNEQKMVTSDLDIINITWSFQYKIKSAKDYLFNSRDVGKNIRDIGEAMMSEVVGDTSFDALLNSDRAKVESEVQKKMQEWLDDYSVGILVTQVIIIDALPPLPVVGAFNEVNRAAQDMDKMIYEAEIKYLERVPYAYGEAQKLVLDAKTYATNLVYEAKGESARFELILNEYTKYPQITNDRLYIEAMESIFKNIPNTIVDPKVSAIVPVLAGVNKPVNQLLSSLTNPLSTQVNPTAQAQSINVPLRPSAGV